MDIIEAMLLAIREAKLAALFESMNARKISQPLVRGLGFDKKSLIPYDPRVSINEQERSSTVCEDAYLFGVIFIAFGQPNS